jgi:hypothetical protein
MAAANAINLGRDPAAAVAISGRWAERQAAQGGDAFVSIADSISIETRLRAKTQDGRLYVSFHYSMYALLYRALAEHAASRTVCAVIGEQSEAHKVALERLAARYAFQLTFVESGPSMIRKVRQALKAGQHAVILLDVPWARGEAPADLRYAAPGGAFLARSTVARLVDLIDADHRFVMVRRTSGVQVDELAVGGVAEAFGVFGQALIDDPADYERLDSLHRFFDFDAPKSTIVTFALGEERFAVHPSSNRSWSISPSKALEAMAKDGGVCADQALHRAFADLVRDDVDAILSI